MLVTYQEARYHRALALTAAKAYLDAQERKENARFVKFMVAADIHHVTADADASAVYAGGGPFRIGNIPGRTALGGGLYARAWKLNDQRVLKVARPDGTADYIKAVYEACVADPHNPPEYAPRVYDYGVLSRHGMPMAWYAVMEYVYFDPDADREELFGDYDGRPEDYFEAAATLYGCTLDDLHSGNYGFTRDGRLVLTDPSSKQGEPTCASVYSRASHLLSAVRPKLP